MIRWQPDTATGHPADVGEEARLETLTWKPDIVRLGEIRLWNANPKQMPGMQACLARASTVRVVGVA